MDAVVADKPAYILELIEFPRQLVTDWFDDIDHLKTYEEFVKAVERPSFNNRHKAFRDSIFAENFANGDPIRNLVGHLSVLVDEHRWKSAYIHSPFDSVRRLYRQVASIKGSVVHMIKGESARQRHESDKIKDHDVTKLMSRWKDILA